MQAPRVLRTKGTTAAPDRPEDERLLQVQIRRLEEQFNRLKEQVRQTQQLAALGTAAAMMAHEYNNVMTPVVGYARVAAESNDPELMKKALSMTLRQASVLSAMSDRILGLAVNEAQSFEPVKLKAVVEEAVAAMCRDPANDGITRAGDHGVEIRVAATGCGIKPEHLDSIFEPFFTTRGPTEGGPRKGCGLGLALCHEIVTEHNGQITVQSKWGEGTTFTIKLPPAD